MVLPHPKIILRTSERTKQHALMPIPQDMYSGYQSLLAASGLLHLCFPCSALLFYPWQLTSGRHEVVDQAAKLVPARGEQSERKQTCSACLLSGSAVTLQMMKNCGEMEIQSAFIPQRPGAKFTEENSAYSHMLKWNLWLRL